MVEKDRCKQKSPISFVVNATRERSKLSEDFLIVDRLLAIISSMALLQKSAKPTDESSAPIRR
jgi:hypothetical protein